MYVLLVTAVTEFSLSLDQSHFQRHALEIVLLQDAIVVCV